MLGRSRLRSERWDYDPALDYQSGEARATASQRPGAEQQQELAAAISADTAKSLAEQMIARAWATRDKLKLSLPPRYLSLQPGSKLQLDLAPSSWTVEQCVIEGFVVTAELRPSWNAVAQVAADSGRVIPNDDTVASDMTIALFDIPDAIGGNSSVPTIMLAASSPTRGFKCRGVEIVAGEQIFHAETARRKTMLGHSLGALAAGDSFVIDEINALEIQLVDPDQWLISCDDAGLARGDNLSVLGNELLQFGTATVLGQGKFRLTRLLRGRGGTEWATANHSAAEPFAVIQRDALRAVSLPAWLSGTMATASARNLSSSLSQSAPLPLSGESLRPRSPVRLSAMVDSDGNLNVGWTRRSRTAWAWIDGIDAPLGETSERYRVSVARSAGSVELETVETALQISAADLAGLGSGQATIEVRQVGDWSTSHAAQTTVTIG